jgi:serine phosphatase RsbU (regulator of sigma subunit)/HAMP domain-containing protein
LNKIWVKFSIVIVLLLLVLMAVVFQFFTRRELAIERADLQENMERIAKMVASIRLMDTEDDSLYSDWIDRIIRSDPRQNLVYIAVFDSRQRLVAYALNPRDLAVNAEILTPKSEKEIVLRMASGQIAEDSWNDFDHIPVEIRFGRTSRGRVDVGFSLIEFNNQARDKLLVNAYILGIAFIVAVMISILFGRRFTNPLNKLSSAMIAISKGDLAVEVESRSNDEIGDLARSFNYMTTRLREKTAIDDFSRDLVFSLEHSQLIQMVADRIVEYMGASQGALFLLQPQGKDLFAVSKWGWPNRIDRKISIKFSPQKQMECLRRTEPFAPQDTEQQDQFSNVLQRLQLQVEFEQIDLIAPLVSHGETIGFVLLAPELDETGYDPDEKMFLATLCHQGGMAIRNSILLQELTEKERIKREIEIARAVQMSLLPNHEPSMNGLKISGLCIPATEVGGDYYDYFVIDEDRIGIAIADVSGKGASAAFYMAEIKGMMTSLARLISSPKELLSHVNSHLNKNLDKRIFTTMVYGVLNVKSREFVFVRAGHNAVVVRRANHPRDIDALIPQGIGLGLVEDSIFREYAEEKRICFDAGDMLVLYTDGISEAMNARQEEFGEERLYELIASNHVDNTEELQTKIMRSVNDFVKGAQQHDDITMVIAQLF